ncbi:MAG: major capsid protein [Candidatus Thiodiazotropha endolucinida]
MATVGNTFYDLADLYKSRNPDGTTADVIEMLMQTNSLIKDANAIECNDGTTHVHTIRTGYPTVTWGKLYKGIAQSKSGRAQVKDATGFCEALSTVDERILKLAGDQKGAVRLQEAQAFLEAMNIEMESKAFYGNTNAEPETFMGLEPRFNDTTAENGSQIIDAGGSGSDNTSIWFVAWGPNQTNLLYPKGTEAGLRREDMGRQRVLDDNGDPYFAEEELFHWDIGIAVNDWRYVSRVANIDVSEMQAGNVDLYNFLRKAYYRLRTRKVAGGRVSMYCNTDVLEALDGLATNSGTSDNFVRLGTKEIQGEEVMTYRGIPIRETDALINNENAIS